jgi:hypothetical protein
MEQLCKALHNCSITVQIPINYLGTRLARIFNLKDLKVLSTPTIVRNGAILSVDSQEPSRVLRCYISGCFLCHR